MFKLFIVMVPMIAGAVLAGAVRAETMIPVAAEASPATAVVSTIASEPTADQIVLSADPASASHLPEPATWAIMMTGVGIVGAVSRRRRAQGLESAA